MTSSFTVAFQGSTSILQTDFLPEIKLCDNFVYSCALLDLSIINCTEVSELIALGVLRIDCDIISDSYINGLPSHAIHQFATITATRAKGQTLVEIPKNLNYFPIKVYGSLKSIQISIINKKGEPVNIKSGDIICRINIKRENRFEHDNI